METRPNVVFLVLDTVRRDRVSAYGYDRETTPSLDAFVESASTFTDAVSQAAWSVPSHATMLTGKYPSEHGARTVSPILRDEPTLAQLLSEAGYETYAVSPNEYVRPLTGFGRGFDEFQTPSRVTVPQTLVDLGAPAVNWITSTASVRRPVERLFNACQEFSGTTTSIDDLPEYGYAERVERILEDASEPFFLFVNLIDAHLPRSPAPEQFETFVDDELRDVDVVANERAHTFGDSVMDERAMRKMSQLYDADLRTMDERFGELYATLESAGVLEDSLVVVVADHGEHLGEFDLVGHQHSVFEEVVSVPLAIQFPDGGPDRVDEQVEIRRLFHTVLDETGVQSWPERTLASGIGDETTYGEFFSPMLDVDQFLWKQRISYDRSLLGEPLSFVRQEGVKLVRFDGKKWLFELPERENGAIARREAFDVRELLSEEEPVPAETG